MSSKRRIRRKSCTGKVRHESAAAGWAAINSLHRTRGDQGRMTAYRCQFCKGWHVGHY